MYTGYKSKNLLSVGADAKTIKSLKKGMLTGVLYLAPNDISGHNTCANATEGCKKACLYTSGYGRFNDVQKARIRKTKWFFKERDSFMAQLVQNAESLEHKAHREKMIPAIRLNGTSDIPFEKIRVVRQGINYRNIMRAFPGIQFYDYTKILNRKMALAMPNYHLTYSLAEDNDAQAIEALKQGYNLAVVMRLKRNDPKPKTWGGYPVIDGDEFDARFLDPDGDHIVALSAKADAIKDTSGFVRNPNTGFNISMNVKVA